MKIKRILSMVLALVLSIGAMSITAFAAEETMYGIGFVLSLIHIWKPSWLPKPST